MTCALTAGLFRSLLGRVEAKEIPEPSKEEHQKARVMGLLFIVLGGFLLKIGLFDVLAEAEAHAESVKMSSKGVMLAPPFMMMGLLLVIIGKPKSAEAVLDPKTGAIKPLGWLALVGILGPGLILYLWLQSQLASLGYK